MIRIVLITLLLGTGLMTSSAWAQKKGSIEVNIDSNVRRLLSVYNKLLLDYPGMDGFRIQIFFDSGNTSKQTAMSVKKTFETRFPDIKVYLSFEEPNYKVRVGNFRSKLDAEGCLKKIAPSYPSAFVVPDFIEFPKIAE